MLREATLTFSDYTETVSLVESDIVRVVFLNTTEIIEKTRLDLKKQKQNKKKKKKKRF